MMRSIVDLDETRVREIMTPRTDIVALPAGDHRRAGAPRAARGGHSRFPVYRETIDDVVGILHVRDLVRAWEERREERADRRPTCGPRSSSPRRSRWPSCSARCACEPTSRSSSTSTAGSRGS